MFEMLWKLTLKYDFCSQAYGKEGLDFDAPRNQSPRIHQPAKPSAPAFCPPVHAIALYKPISLGANEPWYRDVPQPRQPDARGSHVWQPGTVRSMLSRVRSHFCRSELGAWGSQAIFCLWVCQSQRRRRSVIA